MNPGDTPGENILLVGFMGAGKSSVGRLAARARGLQFVDLDREIERQAGCSIPDIFDRLGEEAFRQMETDALGHIEPGRGLVVSCGGGIVGSPLNRALLRELGFVVWLTATEEEIFDRVSRTPGRPLLQTPDPRATIGALLAAREPLYREVADLILDTTGRSFQSVVDALFDAYDRRAASAH